MPVALAIDFGGTKVEAALVDERGTVRDGTRFRRPTGSASGREQLWDAVAAVATAALAARRPREPLLGVGIGAAGPVDLERGLVSPLNLPAWRDFPLLERVGALVPGTPVRLRVDGLCIALAEHWVGAARGHANAMGMVVSTGIGGGLILDGRAVTGPTGNAGHIGHIEVGGFDDRCACGGVGCVEAVASGPSTVAWARAQGWDGRTGEDLAESHAAGDPVARAAVRRAGRAIGQAIASATALVDLEIVAIGGGFARVSPDLFEEIRLTVAERHAFGFVTKVAVVPSGLSVDGPLIGAAALVHRAGLLS